MKRYLSYEEAVIYTSLSRDTLRRAVKSGRLKASGVHKGTRFHVEDIDRWMEVRGK